jgi:hypothetical protein
MQETATIEGMLLDLSKGDCSTHLATLGLTESVAELADANSRYKALAAQRTTSVSDAKTSDSKSFRAELDALYAYISDVAFAHNVVNPTTELARYIRGVNDINTSISVYLLPNLYASRITILFLIELLRSRVPLCFRLRSKGNSLS